MTELLFDKLAYMDRLKRAGISEDHARAHTEAIEEALRETVATKADLRTETVRLENYVRTEVTRLENRIDLAVRDLTIRLGAMIVAAFAALASIKFFG
jgi:hypothetical protein